MKKTFIVTDRYSGATWYCQHVDQVMDTLRGTKDVIDEYTISVVTLIELPSNDIQEIEKHLEEISNG